MREKPVVIITPVDRYLGFSAPISPIEQFADAAKRIDIDVVFKDPQKIYIFSDKDNLPKLYDADGEVFGSAFFMFAHDHTDRNMIKYIAKTLEMTNQKVINGYKALTVADDKGLLSLELANRGIPCAKSVIASVKGDTTGIIKSLESDTIIGKTTGFTAGGVGIQPIPADIDYLAPLLWSIRANNMPKVIQDDLDSGRQERSVIRAYVVGGKLIGCYTTTGYSFVNCAGLTRESVAKKYIATEYQTNVFLEVASIAGTSGYCRIDTVGGDNFAIIEINPIARIDADVYGMDIPFEILKYAKQLGRAE